MAQPATGETAARLWESREAGDPFPAWLNGALTLEDALATQLLLLDRELARGEKLAGWKIGLTSPRARASLNADVRPFGYILAGKVFEAPATVDASKISGPAIEPELCFTFGRAVSGADVPRDEVMSAVASVSAGFEVNEARRGSVRPDLPALVADRLTQWGIVAGSGVSTAGVPDTGAIACRLECDGKPVYEGVSRDELDDHFDSLTALVRALGRHGRGVESGQRVITGAFARREVKPGQRWRATFSGVGEVEVRFP
ncbi:MAG: 2-keto-4-pentenoate hydratase [Dehalococcoidia bacterium]